MKVVDEDVLFAIAERVAAGTATVDEAHEALKRVAIDVPDDPAVERRSAALLADLALEGVRTNRSHP